MVEKGFIDALITTIEKELQSVVVIRPADSFTLGVPDILAWAPLADGRVWAVAIEAKQLRPMMEDPFHKGRRTGMMLKHPFTGPQISMLRKLKAAGVDAFGLVRASDDTAFRIDPDHISAKTGNFTHEEMVEIGRPIDRVLGRWRFWENA